VARNLSLALGRPAPSLGIREAIAGVVDTFALIAAAGRIGRAVNARATPSAADLKLVGLENEEILRPPYRF
jgi:hypothetical protein